MKIVSFNINSIRARLHQLEAVVEKHAPEVIGLQETKVADEAFPLEAVQSLGYEVQYHGQKGHYGVALLSKKTPESVIKGFPEDGEESQKRFVGCTFLQENGRKLSVFNGYFPQGENRDHPLKFPAKRKFYADLKHYLSQNLGEDHDCVLMGDANVAPLDIDIGIGEQNKKRWLNTGKCCFLPEERAWLAAVMELGLLDVYRYFYPDKACYSWFDYRSRGFEADPKRGLRIDLILVNSPLLKRCKDAGIDHDIRGMEKPSDHSPVWVEVE